MEKTYTVRDLQEDYRAGRILDWCAMEGVDVDELLHMKLAYNKGRPYRHGGKEL